MSKYFDKSYREIIKEASSDSPTPGGGSVAAMAACLGNAMVSMVGNLTAGKEKYAEYDEAARAVVAQTAAISEKLEKLVDEDMEVFGQFMDTLKMPKNSDEEKAVRTKALQAAYIAATEVPLTIAETCLEVLEVACDICSFGNKSAISDVGVGAYIAEAALKGALLSVDINLGGIKDQEYKAKAASRKNILIAQGADLREKAVVIVKERL